MIDMSRGSYEQRHKHDTSLVTKLRLRSRLVDIVSKRGTPIVALVIFFKPIFTGPSGLNGDMDPAFTN